jgi:hypothetical protein
MNSIHKIIAPLAAALAGFTHVARAGSAPFVE